MVFQAVGKLLGKHKMKKKASAETEKLYLEPRYTSARILDADVLMLVALPKGLNVDEWLASNGRSSGQMKKDARENALDHSMQIMLPASSKKS